MVIETHKIYRKRIQDTVDFVQKSTGSLPKHSMITNETESTNKTELEVEFTDPDIAYAMTIFNRVVQVQMINYSNHGYFEPHMHLISIFGSKTKKECCKYKLIWSPSLSSFFCELHSECLLNGNKQLLIVVEEHRNKMTIIQPYESPTFIQSHRLTNIDGQYGFVAPNTFGPCPDLTNLMKYIYTDTEKLVSIPNITVKHPINEMEQVLGYISTRFGESISSSNTSFVLVSNKTGKICCKTKKDNGCIIDINICVDTVEEQEILIPLAYNEIDHTFSKILFGDIQIPAVEVDTTQMFFPCFESRTYHRRFPQKHFGSNDVTNVSSLSILSILFVLGSYCIAA